MLKLALALTATLAQANTQDDDVAGIFGSENEWKTGFVEVDKSKERLFYWLLRAQ